VGSRLVSFCTFFEFLKTPTQILVGKAVGRHIHPNGPCLLLQEREQIQVRLADKENKARAQRAKNNAVADKHRQQMVWPTVFLVVHRRSMATRSVFEGLTASG
jgi:hypothetical protein